MKSENSKLVIGLIVGAAVGAGIAYLLSGNKKEELIDTINETVDQAKKKIGKAINQGIEELDEAVDKVSTIAQSAIERIKPIDASKKGAEKA